MSQQLEISVEPVTAVASQVKQERKKKEPKKKEWKSFGLEQYRAVLLESVHLSAKAVNTNVGECGIRVAGLTDLPYIAVSTVPGVATDYLKNASLMGASRASVMSQVNAVRDGIAKDKFVSVPQDEAEWIANILRELPAVVFDAPIDCRLRQIILPAADGTDLALTPLHSAGLSKSLWDAEKTTLSSINAERERAGERPLQRSRLVRRARMGYGGSNPQNAGGLVYCMSSALLVMPPVERMDVRAALSIHYKGIDITPPRRLLNDYFEWLKVRQASGKKSGQDTRQAEEDMIISMVRCVKSRACRAASRLKAHAGIFSDTEDGQALLDAGVDPVVAGLLIPTLRTPTWGRDFSDRLARKIAAYRKQNVVIGLTGHDIGTISSIIAKEIMA